MKNCAEEEFPSDEMELSDGCHLRPFEEIKNSNKRKYNTNEEDPTCCHPNKKLVLNSLTNIQEADVLAIPNCSENAARKVSRIEMVMLEILLYLKLYHLKICRDVNTDFTSYATKIMTRRKLTTVKFVYNWQSNNYILNYHLTQGKKTNLTTLALTDFTKYLKKNCYDFPSESFEFRQGTLRAKDLQEFLTNCGRQVKDLVLDVFIPDTNYSNSNVNLMDSSEQSSVENNPPTTECLKKLLVEQVPNLQILGLNKSPKTWKNMKINDTLPEPQGKNNFILTNLKQLCIEKKVPRGIILELVKASVNLKRFYWNEKDAITYIRKTEMVLEANKFHLLKKMIIPMYESYSDFDFELFETIRPDAKSQLTNLTIVSTSKHILELCPRIAKILSNILQASQFSLKQFNSYAPRGQLSLLDFPILHKVEIFVMEIKCVSYPDQDPEQLRNSQRKLFPDGFQFNSVFPKLLLLHWNFRIPSLNEIWEDYFGDWDWNPLMTVKDLTIHANKLPVSWFQKFSQIFPAVFNLSMEIENIDFTEEAISCLWNLDQLIKLKIDINYESRLVRFPVLDSFFTGFSWKKCKELLNSSKDIESVLEVENMRRFPSILKLKKLEKLCLTFVDKCSGIRLRYPTVLTHVSGLFAFKMCPMLKVDFRYKLGNCQNKWAMDNALSSMDEYIS